MINATIVTDSMFAKVVSKTVHSLRTAITWFIEKYKMYIGNYKLPIITQKQYRHKINTMYNQEYNKYNTQIGSHIYKC